MRKTLEFANQSREVTKEEEKKGSFWMRDPKTGNWIPESHFDAVDVVELREKLLFKKYEV